MQEIENSIGKELFTMSLDAEFIEMAEGRLTLVILNEVVLWMEESVSRRVEITHA